MGIFIEKVTTRAKKPKRSSAEEREPKVSSTFTKVAERETESRDLDLELRRRRRQSREAEVYLTRAVGPW